MGFNNKIFLVGIEPVLDLETGKTKLQITHETAVYADKQEVGMDEFYSASSNNTILSATFEIPAHLYHGERYILANGRTVQYEISRVGKGRSPAYLRLPVKAVQNKHLLDGMRSG